MTDSGEKTMTGEAVDPGWAATEKQIWKLSGWKIAQNAVDEAKEILHGYARGRVEAAMRDGDLTVRDEATRAALNTLACEAEGHTPCCGISDAAMEAKRSTWRAIGMDDGRREAEQEFEARLTAAYREGGDEVRGHWITADEVRIARAEQERQAEAARTAEEASACGEEGHLPCCTNHLAWKAEEDARVEARRIVTEAIEEARELKAQAAIDTQAMLDGTTAAIGKAVVEARRDALSNIMEEAREITAEAVERGQAISVAADGVLYDANAQAGEIIADAHRTADRIRSEIVGEAVEDARRIRDEVQERGSEGLGEAGAGEGASEPSKAFLAPSESSWIAPGELWQDPEGGIWEFKGAPRTELRPVFGAAEPGTLDGKIPDWTSAIVDEIVDHGKIFKVKAADWDGQEPGCGHPMITQLCVDGTCGDLAAIQAMEVADAGELPEPAGKEENVRLTPDELNTRARIAQADAEKAAGNTTEVKACVKCGNLRPATAECFSRDSKAKDGLKNSCKSCQRLADQNRNRRR